jgi:hypothetical protein
MSHSKEKVPKCDGRLSLAVLLLVASAGLLLAQGWIVFVFFFGALNQRLDIH